MPPPPPPPPPPSPNPSPPPPKPPSPFPPPPPPVGNPQPPPPPPPPVGDPPPPPRPPPPPQGSLTYKQLQVEVPQYVTCTPSEGFLYKDYPFTDNAVPYGFLYGYMVNGQCDTGHSYSGTQWQLAYLTSDHVPTYDTGTITATVSFAPPSSPTPQAYYLKINGCTAYYKKDLANAQSAYSYIDSTWPAFKLDGSLTQVSCEVASPPPPPQGSLTYKNLQTETTYDICTPNDDVLYMDDPHNNVPYGLLLAYMTNSDQPGSQCDTGHTYGGNDFVDAVLLSDQVPSYDAGSISATVTYAPPSSPTGAPYRLMINGCSVYYKASAPNANADDVYSAISGWWRAFKRDGSLTRPSCAHHSPPPPPPSPPPPESPPPPPPPPPPSPPPPSPPPRRRRRTLPSIRSSSSTSKRILVGPAKNPRTTMATTSGTST